MKFEDCIIVDGYNKHSSAYEWFINQEYIPFDMSSDAHGMYWTMYHESVRIDKAKIREYKIEQLLSTI
jgi:hypothetical protein